MFALETLEPTRITQHLLPPLASTGRFGKKHQLWVITGRTHMKRSSRTTAPRLQGWLRLRPSATPQVLHVLPGTTRKDDQNGRPVRWERFITTFAALYGVLDGPWHANEIK